MHDQYHKQNYTMNNLQTNKALHAMTAHSLRYESELVSIVAVIEELICEHAEIVEHLKLKPQDTEPVKRGLKQQLAEAKAVLRMQAELAKKTKNTLALVRICQRPQTMPFLTRHLPAVSLRSG